MKFGHSRVNITPDGSIKNLELQGFGYFLERSYIDILDDIYTNCIYIETIDKKFIVINSDLLNYDDTIVNSVKGAIQDELGINKSNVLMITTHTHAAPSVARYNGCGEYNDEYCKFLIPLIIKAASKAAENATEIKRISSGSISFSPIGFNRAHANGPVDTTLTVLRFELSNNPDYFILNHGCHPVTIGSQRYISADFPEVVVAHLQKDGLNGMFLNAFCGDIDPLRKNYDRPTREGMTGSGEAIYTAFKQLINKASMKEESLSIDCIDSLIDIDLYKITEDEINKQLEMVEDIKQTNPSYYRAVSEWKKIALEKLSHPTPFEEKYRIQALRIGASCILAIQGEIYTQLGLDIKAAFPYNNIILCGNANEAFGYIPTDNSIKEKDYAGYGSCVAIGRLPLAEGTAEKIVKASVNAIKTLF